MGVRILRGIEYPGSVVDYEILFDSVTMWAFGPVMDEGEGDIFCEWYSFYYNDPRSATDKQLRDRYYEFHKHLGWNGSTFTKLEKFGWTGETFLSLPDKIVLEDEND